jgi:hypothetical protein
MISPDKLPELVDAYLDGELNAAETNRLGAHLMEVDENARQFFRQVYLHRELRSAFLARSDAMHMATETRPTPVLRGLVSKWTALGFASKAFGFAVSGLLITYFAVLMFSVIWDQVHWADRKAQDLLAPENLSFATLTRTDDCYWEPNLDTKADDRRQQKTLQVRSGLAELKFAQGAKVIVQGPAEFEVCSANRGFLRRGKLVALVPREAVGFTVATPTADIVDLGTEFGVEADGKGAIEVQVFKGKIELRAGTGGPDELRAQLPITLTAGTARRIEAARDGASPLVKDLTFSHQRFSSLVPAEAKTRLRVSAAICSSSSYPLDRRSVNRLIDGSGMNGDRHTNLADGTMWNSSLGKTEGEFLLFDLGKPCRLESMKVWNYNEAERGLFRFRGVAKADIFVSMRGNEDPLSRPDDWKLAVKDQEFMPADGTETYATPDEVPLGGVEARYVAIVIKKIYGVDPSYPDPHMQCGGLSEVQFYGERVSSKK